MNAARRPNAFLTPARLPGCGIRFSIDLNKCITAAKCLPDTGGTTRLWRSLSVGFSKCSTAAKCLSVFNRLQYLAALAGVLGKNENRSSIVVRVSASTCGLKLHEGVVGDRCNIACLMSCPLQGVKETCLHLMS